MLKTLRRIVQEVNSAPDLPSALRIMVERVRVAVDTQAATIYLLDSNRSQFVMMATEGLNPGAVGTVRFDIDKGLVGLVARREEPLNLEKAADHEAFYHLPAAGEEQYQAFLGVPIIHHRRLFGVLVVQQEDERCYDESEEAFLVTLSAQLAGVIAHAAATGNLSKLTNAGVVDKAAVQETAAIVGIPSVPGVGIGQAVVVYPPADLDAVPDKTITDSEAEIALLTSALKAVQEDILQLKDRLQTSLPKAERALFDVYLQMLEYDSLGIEVVREIQQGQWAQAALRKVIKTHINEFEALDDEYLRERASDFRDIGRRVLSHLQAGQKEQIQYPENTILVGDEVTPAALAEVPEGHLVGLISVKGSSNAHVAILARALGIPTVMGAKGISMSELSGKFMVVDGYFGQVYVSPSAQILQEFKVLAAEEQELDESLAELRHLPAETPDGTRIALHVNTGLAVESGVSLTVGSEGVGLFRTEMPFMSRDRFPSEKEQCILYRQLLNAFSPRPVTMRTLDIGGDKMLPYFPIEEDNPFLGWRGIRVTLDHPDIFLIQVRAMLRASLELNNLRILLPMVTSVGELDESLHLIKQAHQEVIEEGDDVPLPPIGAMVEVPSAVYQARDFAKRVDFLSIGSNDLTQYLLAVDRNNARVAGLYDSLHPAVLQALEQVIEGAHSEGKHVSLCGEMASDPASVVVLLAMGFDSLSMNPSSLPRAKWVIRNFTLAEARKLLGEVLQMDNPTLIRFHLEKALDEKGLGGLIRAGKK